MSDPIDTKVAVLETNVDRVMTVFDRLEANNERVSEVLNTVSRMLAIHEERHKQHEIMGEDLYRQVDERREEWRKDIQAVHSRISEVEAGVKKVLEDGLKQLREDLSTGRKDHEDRIRDLEKRQWMIFGGSIVIGLFAKQLVGFLFTLIPS